ncbi:MAG: HAD family phosphatase [Sphingobacteriales bacterium]|nr:MAG: HAD family phosphatase [Sphingobacteriales bacterium]
MIKTVIFDLGGVLIDWNPDYLYKTIFDSEEEMRWFYDNICTPDWNEEQDAGRDLHEGTEILVKKFPEHEHNIRAYYSRWEEMLNGPIHDTVEIFKELKASNFYQILALTNWSHQTFPIALERFDFLHWFDGKVVSGEEKTRKPFLDIYEMVINRFNVDPASAVYIDDNVRNLVPARELGMAAIHFKNPAQLREELKALGVKLL